MTSIEIKEYDEKRKKELLESKSLIVDDKINDLVKRSFSRLDDLYDDYSKFAIFLSLQLDYANIKFVQGKSDIDDNYIHFLNDNGDIRYKSRYEILGYSAIPDQCWIWAWSVPNLKKNLISTATRLLKYGLELDNDKDAYVKGLLINSKINNNLSNKPGQYLNIHLILSICLLLTKNKIIFPIFNYGRYYVIYVIFLDSDQFKNNVFDEFYKF